MININGEIGRLTRFNSIWWLLFPFHVVCSSCWVQDKQDVNRDAWAISQAFSLNFPVKWLVSFRAIDYSMSSTLLGSGQNWNWYANWMDGEIGLELLHKLEIENWDEKQDKLIRGLASDFTSFFWKVQIFFGAKSPKVAWKSRIRLRLFNFWTRKSHTWYFLTVKTRKSRP